LSPKALLLVPLAIVGLAFVAFWAWHFKKTRATGRRDDPATDAGAPTFLQIAIGAVANFFDTLGVSSFAATIAGRPLTATRPKTFFRPDGDMPERVSLRLHLPSTLTGGSRAQFIARLADCIAAAEKDAAGKRAATGRSIIGRGVVRRQHWNDSPQTREPRRRLSPRVACRDTWRRIEALARNKAWLEAYRQARALFIAGKKACFPAGTFWLPRVAGADCEPFAPS